MYNLKIKFDWHILIYFLSIETVAKKYVDYKSQKWQIVKRKGKDDKIPHNHIIMYSKQEFTMSRVFKQILFFLKNIIQMEK